MAEEKTCDPSKFLDVNEGKVPTADDCASKCSNKYPNLFKGIFNFGRGSCKKDGCKCSCATTTPCNLSPTPDYDVYTAEDGEIIFHIDKHS